MNHFDRIPPRFRRMANGLTNRRLSLYWASKRAEKVIAQGFAEWRGKRIPIAVKKST